MNNGRSRPLSHCQELHLALLWWTTFCIWHVIHLHKSINTLQCCEIIPVVRFLWCSAELVEIRIIFFFNRQDVYCLDVSTNVVVVQLEHCFNCMRVVVSSSNSGRKMELFRLGQALWLPRLVHDPHTLSKEVAVVVLWPTVLSSVWTSTEDECGRLSSLFGDHQPVTLLLGVRCCISSVGFWFSIWPSRVWSRKSSILDGRRAYKSHVQPVHTRTHTEPLPTASYGDPYGIYSLYLQQTLRAQQRWNSVISINHWLQSTCRLPARSAVQICPHPVPPSSTSSKWQLHCLCLILQFALTMASRPLGRLLVTALCVRVCSRRATRAQFQILSLPTNKNKTRKPNNNVIGWFPISVLVGNKTLFASCPIWKDSVVVVVVAKKLPVANKQQYILLTNMFVQHVPAANCFVCTQTCDPGQTNRLQWQSCNAQKEKETLGNATFISLLQWGLFPRERLTWEPLVSH